MKNSPVLIVAKNASQLRTKMQHTAPDETFVVCEELSEAPALVALHSPEVVHMLRDTDFSGPEFRAISQMDVVKWVQVSGSGYDFLLPIERSDLLLTNGQGLRSRDLAEMLMGCMISLNNGLHMYRDRQKQRLWQPHCFRPLAGQTLLLVGTGLIGTWVAKLAKAFGMHVIGSNRNGRSVEPFDEIIRPDALEDVLPRCDVVSLHLRLDDSTRNYFGARQFDLMKEQAIFINTGRGGLVDEAALVEALQSRRIRGAYLDVFETEPLPESSPLWQMDNVLVTPHAADLVENWDYQSAQFFAENLLAWRQGLPMQNIVQMGRGT